jgi:hypothetical protein
MKTVLNNKEEKPPQFIIVNEYCQVYCGLKRGYPSFSDDMDEARELENDKQLKMIQYGTNFKLEKIFI